MLKPDHLEDIDVLVAGGGPAGVGAGLAAARAGAKTLVIERWGILGGLATAGLFPTWPIDRGMGKQDYSGLLKEILARLREHDALDTTRQVMNTELLYNEEVLKSVLVQMAEEANLHVLYQSLITRALVDDNRVEGVVVENKAGRREIRAKMIIDCTGDGDVAASAGVPFNTSPDTPWPKLSILYRIRNVNWQDIEDPGQIRSICNSIHTRAEYSELRRKPSILGFMPSLRPHDLGAITGYAVIFGFDGVDPFGLSNAETLLRRFILDSHVELKQKHPAFRDSFVDCTSPTVSVEATRRIVGEYSLTASDVINCHFPEDTIAISTPKGAHRKHFQDVPEADRRGHGIPYRTLVPVQREGLLVAGRCFSSEYDAHEGHPYIPTCVLMGQAAGTAAAMALQQGCRARDLSSQDLRSQLVEQDVCLGV